MAQGGLKVKAKLPANVKKNKSNLKKTNKKQKGFKKPKATSEKQKIQRALEKTIRANIESEMRARAGGASTSSQTKTSKGKK